MSIGLVRLYDSYVYTTGMSMGRVSLGQMCLALPHPAEILTATELKKWLLFRWKSIG